MASFTKLTWVDEVTPTSAANMQRLEDALDAIINGGQHLGGVNLLVNSSGENDTYGYQPNGADALAVVTSPTRRPTTAAISPPPRAFRVTAAASGNRFIFSN